MLEQLCQQPMQRMMEADPSLQDVEPYNLIHRPRKLDLMKLGRRELFRVEPLLGQREHHQDMVYHRRNRRHQLRHARPRKRRTVHLDHARQ